MLVDEVEIIVKAGDGGNGSVSFRRNAQTDKGGPDGGNGGNGGDVYFQGSANSADLREFQFKKKVVAPDGVSGRKNNLFGKNGSDIVVIVPLGTRIIDVENESTVEIENDHDRVLLAKGGRGGRGNNEFKSALNQTPMEAEDGEKGEVKKVILELRLIADVGLVGNPNAGKSSLLKALTNAKPKIGNYPFTTLDPNLGIVDKIVLADIPGIIEGASKGKGLGIQFLKHTEKTKCLVYCLDVTEENLLQTYQMLRKEFGAYNPSLLEKPHVIALTKKDLVDAKEYAAKEKVFHDIGEKTIGISIYDEVTLKDFKKLLVELTA